MASWRGVAVAGTLLLAAGAGGCYHAIVESGRPASGERIERPWAHSFI